jgi:hypothetical protein
VVRRSTLTYTQLLQHHKAVLYSATIWRMMQVVLYVHMTLLLKLSMVSLLTNRARSGGGIALVRSTLTMKDHNNPSGLLIRNNTATYNGGFLEAYDSINQYENVRSNSAEYGGAFCIENSSLIIIGNMDPSIPMILEDNIATESGAAIFADTNSVVETAKGSFLFHNNRAQVRYHSPSIIFCITKRCTSAHSYNWYGSDFHIKRGGAVYVEKNCSLAFVNVRMESNFASLVRGPSFSPF